jgi:TatA/E family protein of Tat protein translocase
MPQLGPAEILVILVVALLVFGPKRLPEVGRQVGRGLRELRKIQDTVRDEINDVIHHDASESAAPGYPPASYPTPVAPPPTATGRAAPSRFRPAVGPPAAAPPPGAPSPTPRPAAATGPGAGAHAPSKFRAPGR